MQMAPHPHCASEITQRRERSRNGEGAGGSRGRGAFDADGALSPFRQRNHPTPRKIAQWGGGGRQPGEGRHSACTSQAHGTKVNQPRHSPKTANENRAKWTLKPVTPAASVPSDS
jgi:hypothetical protein